MKISMLLLPLLFISSFVYADEAMQRIMELSANDMSQRSDEWLCEPTSTSTCSKAGCKTTPSIVSTRINFPNKQYSRCDSKGCDDHEMTYSLDGMYTLIEIPGSGTSLRSLNDGEKYIEIATTGVAATLNFGSCTPVNQ